MEFHFTCEKDNTHIFCCDPNDNNIINYNTVKLLCEKHEIDWNNLNQTYISFIFQLKTKFFDEINGRVEFSKEQRKKSQICLIINVMYVNVVSKMLNFILIILEV